MNERFVVAGLARVRAPWFAEVAAWANTSQVPIDFLKCVSAADVRARVDGARPVSVVLAGADVPGLDRDLIDHARTRSVTVVVVTDDDRDWTALGAAACLPGSFDAAALLACLQEHARPVRSSVLGAPTSDEHPSGETAWRGALVAVVGGRGCGTSTVAMAVAQGLAATTGNEDAVALADLAGCGDLAMYHDVRDVVPGLQELVEAHRTGAPSRGAVRRMLFEIEPRDYSLLLGLRRTRDWTVLRPRALAASLDSLRTTFRVVVADADAELDGEDSTGSVDIEERNGPSRLVASTADAVVVCGDASLKGIHSMVRVERDLRELGVPSGRVVRVVNRAPRSPRRRAELAAAVRDLAAASDPSARPAARLAPVFVPHRRDLEVCHTLARRLPATIVGPPTAAVGALLGHPPHGDSSPLPDG